MCGISGFIDSQLTAEKADAILSAMLESIAHRGPDARGKWIESPVALGHNRLSIVDLSESGKQPMHGFNCVITFNGEIYNYIELRNELINLGYEFRSHSDTEVVLASYKHWGKSCVNRFIGMWAFALWDKSNQTLFCSRDRFGIKPFYYIQDGDRFYFGSEYKLFRKTPVFDSSLNLDHISRGLQLGWVSYGEQTYFRKLKALPPACNLIYSSGTILIEKYWDLDPAVSRMRDKTESERVEAFKELFLDSIKLHLRSDVEVGACLSGGLDSSAIASAVSVLFPSQKFKAFNIYYTGKDSVDERPWVAKVKEKYPSIEDYYYSPGENEIVEGFEKTIFCNDVPITGSSPISQNFVMKLIASQKIKVVLDGQGSDEYLAGYMHSFYRLLGGMIGKLKIGNAIGEFRAHSHRQQFSFAQQPALLMKSMLSGVMSENNLYRTEFRNYYPFLAKNKKIDLTLNSKSGSKLNVFLYHLLTTTSLPSLLHFEDRNSMMYSIESRVPFLDHRLVELAFALNDTDKFNNGITKVVLRKAMAGILPDDIITRYDKKGFVTPGEIKWLRGPLKFLLEDMDYKNIDFLDTVKTKSIIDGFLKGDNRYANLVWRTASLNYWLKKN